MPTFKLIESQVLSTTAASISFSNIPLFYTDLVLECSLRGDRSATTAVFQIRFNGSSSGYSYMYMENAASNAVLSSFNSSPSYLYCGNVPCASATSGTFSSQKIYIANYSASTHKNVVVDSVMETNAVLAYVSPIGSLWANSSAITSIALTCDVGNFVSNSTVYLYGVRS